LTSSYSTYFHDISDGASNGKYKTVTGYDLLSGWGSRTGAASINLLAPVAGGTTRRQSRSHERTFERGLQQSVYGSGDGQFRLGSHVHQFRILQHSGATYTMTAAAARAR